MTSLEGMEVFTVTTPVSFVRFKNGAEFLVSYVLDILETMENAAIAGNRVMINEPKLAEALVEAKVVNNAFGGGYLPATLFYDMIKLLGGGR